MNITLILTQADLPLTEQTQIGIACFGGQPSPFPQTIHCDIPKDENCSNEDRYLRGAHRYSIMGTVDEGGNVTTDGVVTKKDDSEIRATAQFKALKRERKLDRLEQKHMRKLALQKISSDETLNSAETTALNSRMSANDNIDGEE